MFTIDSENNNIAAYAEAADAEGVRSFASGPAKHHGQSAQLCLSNKVGDLAERRSFLKDKTREAIAGYNVRNLLK